MSKKKMLEEAQVRRMFELAGMPAIGDGFIGGKYAKLAEEEAEEEEKDLEEKVHSEEEEEIEEGGMKYSREEEGEEAMADEAPAEEPEMEMGAEEAPAMDAAPSSDIPQEKIEAIVDAVLAGIEQETGVPLERVPEEGAEAPAEEIPAEEAPPKKVQRWQWAAKKKRKIFLLRIELYKKSPVELREDLSKSQRKSKSKLPPK